MQALNTHNAKEVKILIDENNIKYSLYRDTEGRGAVLQTCIDSNNLISRRNFDTYEQANDYFRKQMYHFLKN